jgi:hypothetical protein
MVATEGPYACWGLKRTVSSNVRRLPPYSAKGRMARPIRPPRAYVLFANSDSKCPIFRAFVER